MISALILSAALAGQAPRASSLVARPASAGHDTVIRKRREAEARKRYARINRALNERYQAEQQLRQAERLAPLIARQQEAQAQMYYQYQAGAALQNIGVAARQDAQTNRLREIGQFGPGYLPALAAPSFVPPSEIIRRQTMGP
jgi:hypothetical protein